MLVEIRKRFGSTIVRIAVSSILMFILLLVGCEASAKQPEVHVEFWTMSMKPKFTGYFQDLVQRFEASHPGVKVEWVDFPWDILQLKLITAIAAGEPPSLVQLNVPWAEEYARDSLIEPVESLIPDRYKYTQVALADLTFNDHIYGFPAYSNVNVIAYNEAIFKAAGLHNAPRNLDEEFEYAKQIYAKTGNAGYAPTLGKIDSFFLQQGLPLVVDHHAVFNSPQHVALVRKLADAYQSGALLKDKLFAEDSFPAVIDAYKGGRLGMLVSAPTAIKRIEVDAPDIYQQTRVASAPLGPSGIADGGWMFHYAMPRGVKRELQPTIADLAGFLTNDENQLTFAKLAGVMPTTVQALANPYFMEVGAHPDAVEQAKPIAAGLMKYSRTVYIAGLEDYDEMRRVLVKAVESGMTGKSDIKLALDQAVTIWNKKLNK